MYSTHAHSYTRPFFTSLAVLVQERYALYKFKAPLYVLLLDGPDNVCVHDLF